MCQPLCTRASARAHANANAHAHARRSENFHRLETLLAQRCFQLIPMEILPHCAAVPLGVMVRGIMESLLDAEALEKLLQEYAPQQYTLELTIDALVSLLIQVSAGHRATVFAAYTADQASMPPTISTSYQALYAKLGRMDPKLSEAIVRFCAEKLRPVLEKLPRTAEPILAGYRTQILDGNVLTGTDHRLTALRQWLNACLPGKSLVALEPDLGLISDLVLCEDAYTQERALLTYILERVQARDLLVFDRNFTTTGFAFGIAERGGSFVGRQHRTNLPVQPVSKLVKCGETETGRIYEQIVRATDPDTGATLLLRRIEVRLFEKTRDGEKTIGLLTNLPETVSAVAIAEIYRKRWTVEVMFKASKQVMGIEGPQHWCRESIEKLAPWVWLMQSVVSLWYLTVGHAVPEAESARRNLGPWDTEWSLGHWVRVLRVATMAATINPDSNENDDCRKLIERVKSYLFYVASAA